MALDTVGTVFAVGDGTSPDDYAAFCVNSIDPVGATRALIDVTTLCSTTHEYRLALTDGQEINIEAFYDPADAVQESLRTALANGTTKYFKITLSDDSPGTDITFTALVTAWSIGAAVDGVYPLRITLKPISPLVWSNEA